MNDAEAMCFFEHVANLRCDVDCFGKRKTTFTCERLGECFTFNKLHHDEMTTIGQISSVEDHRGVGVAKFRHRPRLAKKAVSDVRITRKFAFDDLYCDWPFESEMGGKVNSAHAAGPDFTFYSESASDKLG